LGVPQNPFLLNEEVNINRYKRGLAIIRALEIPHPGIRAQIKNLILAKRTVVDSNI
jgi:hypothetical protein